jgi:hypothetical protein
MLLTELEIRKIIISFIIMTPLSVLKSKLLNKKVSFKEIFISISIILIYKILSDRLFKKNQ